MNNIPPIAPKYPLAIYPRQSDHGDVHDIIVCRSNGRSLTLSDYKWVYYKITGRYLSDDELNINIDWFAEEDRI